MRSYGLSKQNSYPLSRDTCQTFATCWSTALQTCTAGLVRDSLRPDKELHDRINAKVKTRAGRWCRWSTGCSKGSRGLSESRASSSTARLWSLRPSASRTDTPPLRRPEQRRARCLARAPPAPPRGAARRPLLTQTGLAGLPERGAATRTGSTVADRSDARSAAGDGGHAIPFDVGPLCGSVPTPVRRVPSPSIGCPPPDG